MNTTITTNHKQATSVASSLLSNGAIRKGRMLVTATQRVLFTKGKFVTHIQYSDKKPRIGKHPLAPRTSRT